MADGQNYQTVAKNLLRAELKRRGLTYRDLADRLAQIGVGGQREEPREQDQSRRFLGGVPYRVSGRNRLPHRGYRRQLGNTPLYASAVENILS